MHKNRKLHKFATTNSIFLKNSIISDMHHRIAYMYIKFQQNMVSRSVKKPYTQIYLPKNRKLHKFATCNLNFETKLFSDMHIFMPNLKGTVPVDRV